jgi:asparagine synthase (glutamine-hydrolysing)
MCGFTGFLQSSNFIAADVMPSTVGRMAETLHHRGPDDCGVWTDPAAGIALGHKRLSIIDLSPEGHQPMASASGRYVIAFNGEIYNFQVLRDELEMEGFRWRGHSDTEVMLAAFERWGVEGALQRFNGMFAFALWDGNERRLHLARDRLGEKPLYYGWCGRTLLFGSELKALRAHPAWSADISRDALASYLRHNCVPGPLSIYHGIAKLPPAHYLTVSVDSAPATQPRAYWSLREAAEAGHRHPVNGKDEKQATDELDTLLRDAVRIRTVADVPVGVFLSGGIDSSTIVALMQAQSMRPVKSFSIGFEEEGYNEAQHAKVVAKHLGTDHTELYVTPEEAMSVIPTLPGIYDEPFADSSQIPTILVSKLARKDVTVSLSGDGGDELFCGYVRYFWGRRIWNKIGGVPTGLRSAASSALTALSTDSWDRMMGGVSRLLPRSNLGEVTGDRIHKLAEVLSVPSADVLYEGLISHWPDPDSIVHGAREPQTGPAGGDHADALKDFTARMMYRDALTYLPDDILVKVDRASMSVSLEARVPLLDHRVVEYAWRVPLSMKIRNDQGKWLLRQVLYRYVPRELIERPKMGFGVPIDSWLRGPLRDWAENLLGERKLHEGGYFDAKAIRKKWAEHLSGARNWQYWLWDVLMFQAWLDEQRARASAI